MKEIIKRKWNGGNGREKRIEQQVFENGFIIDNERISKMRYSGYIRQMAYSQMLVANEKNTPKMLDYILDITKDLLSNSQYVSDKDKQIITDEVRYAVNQTRTHIQNTRNGSIDRTSAQLSNIWRRVGNRLRRIKNSEIQGLANTIEQKSRYWSDPINFDKSMLIEFEMKLTQVESKLQQIGR